RRGVAPQGVVELLEDVGNPAAAGLDRDPDQVGKAVVYAGADDLRHVGDHVGRADGGEAGEVVPAHALGLGLVDLPHDADVEVDGDAVRLRRRPELVVLGAEGGPDARHGVQPHAAEPELQAALHLADGGVDAERRDVGQADQPRGIDAHDLFG